MTDSARRPERILVVDDRPMTREIIRDMLECEGFDHVKVAAVGMQALMLMSVEDFSLVVTDWDMAPMSGPDLLACTRHHPRMKEIPFVLATGKFEAGEVIETNRAGFDLIVVKPFATEALANEVNTGLQSANVQAEKRRRRHRLPPGDRRPAVAQLRPVLVYSKATVHEMGVVPGHWRQTT